MRCQQLLPLGHQMCLGGLGLPRLLLRQLEDRLRSDRLLLSEPGRGLLQRADRHGRTLQEGGVVLRRHVLSVWDEVFERKPVRQGVIRRQGRLREGWACCCAGSWLCCRADDGIAALVGRWFSWVPLRNLHEKIRDACLG